MTTGNLLEFYGNAIDTNGSNGLCTAGVNTIHLGLPYNWEGYNSFRGNAGYEINVGQGGSSLSVVLSTSSIHDVDKCEISNYSANQAVYANNCYWDPNPVFSGPITLTTNQYYYTPTWDCQPRTAGSPLGKVVAQTIPDSIPWILDPRIPDAEKVKRCKDIISKTVNSVEAKTTLGWLYSVIRADYVEDNLGEKNTFVDYLQTLRTKFGDTETGKLALYYMIIWKMLENNSDAVITLSQEALKTFAGDDKKWVLVNLALTQSHSGQKEEAKSTTQELKRIYSLDKNLIALIDNDIAEANVAIADTQIQPSKQPKTTESIIVLPTDFNLVQNYPNPFNPTTTINYQLASSGRVTLKVFDMLGQEVATLVDGIKDAGYYTATFDGSRYSSGVYFVRITVMPQDGFVPFTKTMKMLMVK